MRLSIIVPVYNMAADGKLEYCLESLVHQTISDYEIIAVDDCSTDNSREILTAYEQKYPSLFRTVFLPENHRQGGAKNKGLELARGEWIGFIDSDDWVTPDFYERLITRGEETGADMVGCDYQITHEHSMAPGKHIPCGKPEQSGELTPEKYRSLILDGGSLVIKVYRRRVIIDQSGQFDHFPEGIFYEDNALGCTWMLNAKHYEYIPEPLYYYYQHETSTVHTHTESRCEDRMAAGEFLLAEAEKNHFSDEYQPEIEYRFTLLYYINTLFSYMQGVRPRRLSFVRHLGKSMRAHFPAFRKNPYYTERTNEEQQKFIRLQQRSTVLFFIYYMLLHFYRKFFKKYEEIISYLIFGGLTFVINYVAYALLTLPLHLNYLVATVISWVVAVVFAYWTNRCFVFKSKNKGTAAFFKEFFSFMGARIATEILELVLMFVFTGLLGFNSMIVKLIAQVLVIVGNYILSKLWIFRKKKEIDDTDI